VSVVGVQRDACPLLLFAIEDKIISEDHADIIKFKSAMAIIVVLSLISLSNPGRKIVFFRSLPLQPLTRRSTSKPIAEENVLSSQLVIHFFEEIKRHFKDVIGKSCHNRSSARSSTSI
jgi:hypothetical protein